MSIATEKISFSQRLTSYRVKVKSFKHKMNKWKNGRPVLLKAFKIDGSSLRLELYQNGSNKEDIKHVSLFIATCSLLTRIFPSMLATLWVMETLTTMTVGMMRMKSTGAMIQYPECPICLEDMTHETRIMQCYGGHPMCGVCHDKLETKICPSCKKGMIGRMHGMEKYLRTLFSDQNGN